jgi:hypothetical protein
LKKILNSKLELIILPNHSMLKTLIIDLPDKPLLLFIPLSNLIEMLLLPL